MKQDEAATGQRPDIALTALSVVLIADNIDPSMINPDFLRNGGIVDSDLQTEQPPISTPVFSQVTFEGGLAVIAQPARFAFVQQGESLEGGIASPNIATRFLEKVPHPAYKAIGINPTGVKPPDDGPGSVATTLIGGGEWMAFRDVSPAVFLKAVYSCEERQITMDVQDVKRRETGGSEARGLRFAVNVHRDVSKMDQGQRIARLMSILSAWKEDLSDFRDLVAKFDMRGVAL